MDHLTCLRQIGPATVMAVSGGRWRRKPEAVELPVAHGYSVEIEYLRGVDLYAVRRLFRRGGRTWVKGERLNVFADELSDAVYRASCYHEEM